MQNISKQNHMHSHFKISEESIWYYPTSILDYAHKWRSKDFSYLAETIYKSSEADIIFTAKLFDASSFRSGTKLPTQKKEKRNVQVENKKSANYLYSLKEAMFICGENLLECQTMLLWVVWSKLQDTKSLGQINCVSTH